MLIAFFCIGVPDRCGAFYSDLCLARELQSRGHGIVLIDCTKNQRNFAGGVYEGFPWKPLAAAGKELDQSSVWMSPHYPMAPTLRMLNLTYKRPVIFTLHFAGAASLFSFMRPITWKETFWYVNSSIPLRLLNNQFPRQVIHHEERHPFMDAAVAKIDTPGKGEYITLVNANMNKGLAVFLKIAALLPDYKFLGVRSYYNTPTDATLAVTDNIEWIDFTRDIKSIYARTRILLVPSAYESFCVVAAEAMLNGIPVLYTRPYQIAQVDGMTGTTEGMHNWISPAGIACDRTKPQEWADAIRSLDDPDVYQELSEKSVAHAEPLFGTAASAADYVVAFAKSEPVKLNALTTVGSEPRVTVEPVAGPGMQQLLQRPSQPASWRNGKLTFGRR